MKRIVSDRIKKKLLHLRLPDRELKVIRLFTSQVKKSVGKDLKTIALFGSKARGDYNKESDIDIYVVVKKNKMKNIDKVSEITADILSDYDILLSPVVYSEFEEQKNLEMHSFFFEAVKNEGIPL